LVLKDRKADVLVARKETRQPIPKFIFLALAGAGVRRTPAPHELGGSLLVPIKLLFPGLARQRSAGKNWPSNSRRGHE